MMSYKFGSCEKEAKNGTDPFLRNFPTLHLYKSENILRISALKFVRICLGMKEAV